MIIFAIIYMSYKLPNHEYFGLLSDPGIKPPETV
jgi:hypothetical protein